MIRITFIFSVSLCAICIIAPAHADDGATEEIAIRNATIGEFGFQYVDNEYGSIVLSRAKSCYRNLSRGANHFFTERLLAASASEAVDRRLIVIRASDSYLNIDLVDIELSGGAGKWSKTSDEQISSLIFDEDTDLSMTISPALAGEVRPDAAEMLLTPVSDLEITPFKLDGFLTHQNCYFLKILEQDGSVNYLTLSADSPKLTLVPTYSDLLYEALAATN